ncbi:PAS domain S-box protein [Antarcticibacterium arcticum]|uniref:histidine kinase n=1 Tax=Antarcticibacterium arcticum TaxID=2585771 RepID=A0A5B8YI90_9FLAO|nr:PAS domain S-box protein [Antarcticibacterium arcticum]QED36547.1 PAS domain S-box protein [Antarcticibacterium arcticum]
MSRDFRKSQSSHKIGEISAELGTTKSISPPPIIIINPTGKILSISLSAKEKLDEAGKDISSSGDSIYSLFSHDSSSNFKNIFQKVLYNFSEEIYQSNWGEEEVNLKLTPVFDQNFLVKKIQISIEESLPISDGGGKRFHKILEQSLDIICTLDDKGVFRDVSSASYRILGYKPQELVGRKYLDFLYPEDMEVSTLNELAIRSGQEKNYLTNRFIHKDGTLVPIIWSAKWDEDENLMFCIGKDASEIREIELRSQEERSMLKAIIDNIPDYIFVIDQDHKTILTNKKFYSDYLGKNSEEETLGLRPVDYFPVEEGLEIMEDNSRIMKSGIPVLNRRDAVYDHKGKKDIILLTKVPFKDENGKVNGLVGIARNITDSYNLEKEQKFVSRLITALGKSESLSSAFSKTLKLISKFLNFESAEAWEIGYDKSILLKSADYKGFSTLKNTDFSKGEGLPGITWKSGKVQVWQDLENDARFIRKEEILEKKLNLGIGIPIIFKEEVIAALTFFGRREKHIELKSKAILKRLAYQISNDVQRKMTENRLNDLFLHSTNLIAVVGMDGYLKKVNPAFTRIFGYAEAYLLTTPFTEFLHPDEKETAISRLKEVAAGLSPKPFQNRCLTHSGEWKWISWTPSLLIEKGIVHVFGMDVTPIKTINLELLKYKNIIESSKDGIGLYSVGTGDVFLNNAFKETLEYEEDELLGEGALEKVYVDKELAYQIYKILISGNYWEGDLQLRNKSGKLLDFYFSGGPIYNRKGELIALFAIHTDISERKRYEVTLKEYGGRIENILESITDGFFSLTPTWEVTYWNKAAENLLGVSREEILGKELWNYFPEAKALLFYSKYEEAMRKNIKVTFEEYFEPLATWFEVNVYPKVDGLSVYFKDITGRKKFDSEIKLARDRFELVARASREAVYDWNISTNLLEWSESYYEVYGFPKISPEKTLQQWELNIHKHDRENVVKKLNASLKSSDEVWNCEYRLIQPDKKIAVVRERGFIIRDENGEAIRMIGSLQDITQLTQNERALEELNHELEKHSRELAVSNAELEQFAYIASHDLQEPLRMVTGFLTQLQRKYDDQLDDKARQYIHFATDGAVRMRQIILDLLDYSRVGKLKYNYEIIDLNLLVNDIIKLHYNLIQDTKTIIEINDLPIIKAALTPLQRVLSNLITNSIKYSKEEVSPVIKISVIEQAKEWEIIVTDNGIGINELFYDKIFVIFQRLHSRDDYSGTGIGLAICKKIVENHGGKIWVVSQEGVGSSFHFTIPKHF